MIHISAEWDSRQTILTDREFDSRGYQNLIKDKVKVLLALASSIEPPGLGFQAPYVPCLQLPT
jgi:hypothetical protein